MIKKKIRFISKFLFIFFIKILNFILIKTKIKILPPIEIGHKFNLDFSQSTRRHILRKNSNNFGKIIFFCFFVDTNFCQL